MIHYSCDRCKREINTDYERRHVVTIEIQAVVGNEVDHLVDEVDHLSELNQLLEDVGDDQLGCDLAEHSHHSCYDLCPECHRQFVKNPLGRDAVLALGFSNN